MFLSKACPAIKANKSKRCKPESKRVTLGTNDHQSARQWPYSALFTRCLEGQFWTNRLRHCMIQQVISKPLSAIEWTPILHDAQYRYNSSFTMCYDCIKATKLYIPVTGSPARQQHSPQLILCAPSAWLTAYQSTQTIVHYARAVVSGPCINKAVRVQVTRSVGRIHTRLATAALDTAWSAKVEVSIPVNTDRTHRLCVRECCARGTVYGTAYVP